MVAYFVAAADVFVDNGIEQRLDVFVNTFQVVGFGHAATEEVFVESLVAERFLFCGERGGVDLGEGAVFFEGEE